MVATFPARLIRRASEAWWIEGASRRGGVSFAGQEQFVVSPASRWRARFSLNLLDDDDYLEAEGFLASLDGPATPFLVGPIDWRGRPWNIDPLTGAEITPEAAARSAQADPAYNANPDTSPTLDFVLDQPIGVNTTTVVIRRNRGGLLKRGQVFQIGDRLHRIVSEPVDQGDVGAANTAAIRPWTRGAYPAGTRLNFANPVGLMRLMPDTSQAIERNTTPLANLSLDLVEA